MCSPIVKWAWSAEDPDAPALPVSQPGSAIILPVGASERVTEGKVRVYRNTANQVADKWYVMLKEDLELVAAPHTVLVTGSSVTTRGAYLSLVVAGDTTRELLPTETATLAWDASGRDSLRLSFVVPVGGRYDLRVCFRDSALTPDQKALTLHRVLLVEMSAPTSVTAASTLLTGTPSAPTLFPSLDKLHLPEQIVASLSDAAVLTHESEAHYATNYAAGQALVLSAVVRDLRQVIQGKKPSLDLRSVYGTAQSRVPLLDARLRFKLDTARHDLFRDGYGTPLVANDTVDMNYLDAQLHLLLLRFHNRVMDHFANANAQQGVTATDADLFVRAHDCVVRHWQWAVLYDTVRGIVDRDVFVDISRCGQQFFPVYKPDDAPSTLPVEFEHALAYVGAFLRRDTYPLTRKGTYITGQQARYYVQGLIPPAPLDMFSIFDAAKWPAGAADSYIPIGSALPARSQGGFHGATRDAACMVGTKNSPVKDAFVGGNDTVASGHAVATRMGTAPIAEEELQRSDRTGVYRTLSLSVRRLPLLAYIMKEGEVSHDGQRLGAAGSRLLTEFVRGFIWAADTHCLDPSWRPSLPRAKSETYSIADIIAWTLRPTHIRTC